jgi:hypothetical protein
VFLDGLLPCVDLFTPDVLKDFESCKKIEARLYGVWKCVVNVFPPFLPASFPTMGTSALLTIVLPGARHVSLWIPMDGYFRGAGADLCRQIRALLTKYTLAQITDLLTALKVDRDDDAESQAFRVEDLVPFLEGKVAYKHDYATSVQFAYTLDFDHQTLTGINRYDRHASPYVLTFTQILAGQVMNDMCASDGTASVEAIVAMFRLLRSEAECTAVRQLLKE